MSLDVPTFHVASIPGNYSSFADEGKTKLEVLVLHYAPNSKKEFMESFSGSIAKVKQVLEKATDHWASLNWELIKDGNGIFTIPRGMMCRLLMMNHWYDHRGSW